MKEKRGQLMIFVLLAIVIVAAVIIVIYFISSKGEDILEKNLLDKEGFSTEVGSINYYIDYCVEYTATNALILIGFQGGYYDKPSISHQSGPVFFPYYYYEGQVNLPTLEFIERELGKYVEDAIVKCINDNFVKYSLEFDDPKTRVKVSDDNVFFETDMTISLSSDVDRETIELSGHSINLNSSLYDIYEVAQFFVETHKIDPEYYCINCIATLLEERGLYGYLFPDIIEDEVTGVMIYENRTNIGYPYVFIFLNKYTGEEVSPILYSGFSVNENSPIDLDNLEVNPGG
jgi:hypothetical protein